MLSNHSPRVGAQAAPLPVEQELVLEPLQHRREQPLGQCVDVLTTTGSARRGPRGRGRRTGGGRRTSLTGGDRVLGAGHDHLPGVQGGGRIRPRLVVPGHVEQGRLWSGADRLLDGRRLPGGPGEGEYGGTGSWWG